MEKNKNLIYIVLAFVAGLLLMYLFNNYKIEKKNNTENTELGEGTIFFDVIFYVRMKDGVSRIINFALNKN